MSAPTDSHLARVLARLQKSETAYLRSDQYAYSRGYLEALRHAALVVTEEMESAAAKATVEPEPVEEPDPCDNCGEGVAEDDVAAERLVYSVGESYYEGLLCGDCLGAPDADTCLKCNGVWWTGVTPPYDEDNCPGSVCTACWHATCA